MGVKVTEPKPGVFWINCDECGEPVTKTNKYGMFCKNLCGLEESKKGFEQVKSVLKGLCPNEDFSFLDKYGENDE